MTILPPNRRARAAGSAGAAIARRSCLVGLAAGAALASPSPARADALPADLRILVGASIGSPHDMHARLFAEHAFRISGRVRIAVESLPRGGGKLAARTLMEGRPDGRLAAVLPTGLLYAEILREPGVAYELARIKWIGSFDAEPRCLAVSARLGLRSLADAQAREAALSSSAVTAASASWYDPLTLNRFLGLRLRPVAGYSTPARNAAVMAGEIDALTGSVETMRSLLDAGEAIVLLRLDRLPPSGLLAAAPSAQDLAAASGQAIFGAMDTYSRLGRLFGLPPSTPDGLVEAWQELFGAVLEDDAYRRQALALGLRPQRISGAAVRDGLMATLRDAEALRRELEETLACGMAIAERGRGVCA